MTVSETRQSVWMWLDIALILFSAAIILYPPVLHFRAFVIPICLVLMPVCFFARLRRLKAEGTGDLPLPALHAQVGRGRRLPTSALDWAAAIALLLATVYMSRG